MSRNLYFFLFTTIIVVAAERKRITYCQLERCRPLGSHSLCKYSPSKTNASNCGEVHSFGIKDNEKYEILELHNALRQKVKRGGEKRGSNGAQPAAKKMNVLRWKKNLAKIAQAWANQCTFNHDDCRDTQIRSVGQNIGYTSYSEGYETNALSEIVNRWYDEVKWFNNQEVPKYIGANYKLTGHYTQMIWAKTKYIGCAVVRSVGAQSKWLYRTYLVCNYAPAGNMVGDSVYPVSKFEIDMIFYPVLRGAPS